MSKVTGERLTDEGASEQVCKTERRREMELKRQIKTDTHTFFFLI